MSTEDPRAAFDLDGAWELDSRVSIRPERFGALLYHFGTRRLSFLKSRTLLDVVQALMLVAEGLLPFVSPLSWRRIFERALQMSDGQIRFLGLVSVLCGLAMLLLFWL